eukprot:scaffold240_cov129-Isochrysis_galbana.AAC.2
MLRPKLCTSPSFAQSSWAGSSSPHLAPLSIHLSLRAMVVKSSPTLSGDSRGGATAEARCAIAARVRGESEYERATSPRLSCLIGAPEDSAAQCGHAKPLGMHFASRAASPAAPATVITAVGPAAYPGFFFACDMTKSAWQKPQT